MTSRGTIREIARLDLRQSRLVLRQVVGSVVAVVRLVLRLALHDRRFILYFIAGPLRLVLCIGLSQCDRLRGHRSNTHLVLRPPHSALVVGSQGRTIWCDWGLSHMRRPLRINRVPKVLFSLLGPGWLRYCTK